MIIKETYTARLNQLELRQAVTDFLKKHSEKYPVPQWVENIGITEFEVVALSTKEKDSTVADELYPMLTVQYRSGGKR